MKSTSNFWPLDFEPEDQIYDNPSWDLPGLRRKRHSAPKTRASDAAPNGRRSPKP
ncbi:MAG TPA: hypothetical protein VHW24_27700 [Bryobacteraceae bacterium]|jgi:hypothetical protein|nr:hypothetical protein [Bryobacteraceae bacterium]